ncbi:MAG: hypothetical protein OXG08_11295 [Gammaproteobacteria bacterium]|nr:hypothetical protein [Gammaproteobacteria bacterium]
MNARRHDWFAHVFVAALACMVCGNLVCASQENLDALSDDQVALLELLSACEKIEDEETRERCYELALKDSEDEGISDRDIEEILGEIKGESSDQAAGTQLAPKEEVDNSQVGDSESAKEPKKRRGIFGRLARAVTSPIRAVLPDGSDNKSDESESDEDKQMDPNEESRGSSSYEAVVVRTGRIDRNVHLVLLDDDKLFEYISPANLRFRNDDTITVIHVETWLTEGYRLDGPRGPIQDAHLIPCHREDIKGNVKRKCELMGIE